MRETIENHNLTVTPVPLVSLSITHRERMPRYNFFLFPHKAFRGMFCELLEELGRVDYNSTEALQELKPKIDFAVTVYQVHNHDESNYFAPMIKSKNVAEVDKWLSDHKEHEHTLVSFSDAYKAIMEEKNVEARRDKVEAMYQSLADYLAGDLEHMKYEQTKIMEIFWNTFSDEEILSIEKEFLRQMDPAYLQKLTPLFLKFHNIDGRAFLLGNIKQNAPPAAFQGLIHLAQTLMPARDFEALKKRLNV